MKLILDIMTYGLGNILPKIIGFLLMPWFTRHLAPADYGIIAMLGWAGVVMSPLMAAGLGAGLAPHYYRPEHAERGRELVWTATLLVVLASGVTLAVVGCVEDALYAWLGVPEHAHVGFRLGLVALAMGALLTPLQGNLQFTQRVRPHTAVTLVATIATLSLSVLFVIVLRRGVQGWFEAALGGQVAAVAVAIWFNRDLGRPRWSGTMARSLLVSGAVLMPTTFLIYVLQHGNKWLLREEAGLAELGRYNLAMNFGFLMNLVVASIQSAWFPSVMAQRAQPAEALERNVGMLVRMAVGLGFLNILFGALARPMVELMTAPAFHPAHELIALSAHAHVWAGLFYVGVIPLYLIGRENVQTAIFIAAALCYACVSLWWIPQWGDQGGALATIVGFAVSAVIASAYASFCVPALRRPMRTALPRLAGILAVWVVAAGLFATEILRPALWPWLSIGAVAMGAVMNWRLLTEADRLALGRMLRRGRGWLVGRRVDAS